MSDFPRFAAVEVHSDSPTSIVVNVTERKPAYIWCTTDTNCFYVDVSGVAFAVSPIFSGNLFFEFHGTGTTTLVTATSTSVNSRVVPIDEWAKVIDMRTKVSALLDNEFVGVGTPVKGGLDYREAHLIMETLAESGRLTSFEVVEVNPILDNRNQSAEFAVELIQSAFGKKII